MMDDALCDTFIQLSRKTWEQMKRNYTTGILVREEAMTGINLQHLKITHPEHIRIRDFSPFEESSKTGADWEWWFVDGEFALGFAVQAKRLNNGIYDIGYQPKKNPLQIETLLKYCSDAADLTPLYCWYNYFQNELVVKDAWGCALADGYTVYKEHLGKNYNVDSIRRISEPWHYLACGFSVHGIENIVRFAQRLAYMSPQISQMALPNGINRVPISVHQNGLPKRVRDMLTSQSSGNTLYKKDRPLAYPGKLIVIERQWPKSTRFDLN